METVMVTQPVQKVTEILVMETWTVDMREQSATAHGITRTLQMPSSALVASGSTGAYRPLPTAST